MRNLSLLLASTLLFIHASAQRPGDANLRSAQGNFNQYLSKTTLKNLDQSAGKKAGMITAFNNTENTVGKRFLFDNWVTGDSVRDMKGSLINSLSFLFNFDKLTGNLLVTQDKINIMSVVPEGISSFILEDASQQFRFEHANLIDPKQFYEALVKGEKQFALYKLHGSKFTPASKRNDGVVQSGNSYDEYKDETQYYIVNQRTNTSSIVSLKPKTIKSVFKAESHKVDAYFQAHKGEVINEQFLIGLVAHLNEQELNP